MSDRPNRQSELHETLPVGTETRAQIQGHLHPRLSHGGPASRGKRKTKRPFTEKAPVHLVLSSKRARGIWSFQHRKNHARIQGMIFTYAERFKIKVHQTRTSGGTLHVLARARDRKNLADFLRVLAGRIAVVVSGAKKGQKRIGKFWNELCWSKLINWGREFDEVVHLIKTWKPEMGAIALPPEFQAEPPNSS